MHEGRVEQVAVPEVLYYRPRSAFVARFIGAANLVSALVTGAEPGSVTISVAGGCRVGVPADDWSPPVGSPATLMVRPERLRVAAAPGSGAAIPATVEQTVFRGPMMRCVVRADDGTELVAHLGPQGSAERPQPGDRVWISWDADAARLLPPAAPPA